MKRGEVWWVVFGSTTEGEIRRERPALIVSNNASNRYLNRVQVVPFTTSVEGVYPSDALVTLSGRPVKAMADQLTTVSKARVTDLAGRLSPSDLQQVERAVMLQLGLSYAGARSAARQEKGAARRHPFARTQEAGVFASRAGTDTALGPWRRSRETQPGQGAKG